MMGNVAMQMVIEGYFWFVLLSFMINNVEGQRAKSVLITYGNFEYKVISQKLSFYEAIQFCETDFGGTLAKIRNEKVQDYIAEQIDKAGIGGDNKNPFFVGLGRDGKSAFIWRDLSELVESDYQDWPTERKDFLPDSGTICVVLAKSGGLTYKWNLNDCKKKSSFICEKASFNDGLCEASKLVGFTGTTQPALQKGTKTKFAISEIMVLACQGKDEKKEVIHQVLCKKFTNGTISWSPTSIPECKQTRCGYPNIPENGYIEATQPSFPTKTKLKYKCNSGYSIRKAATTSCKESLNFRWSLDKSLPKCLSELDSAIGEIGNTIVKNPGTFGIAGAAVVITVLILCVGGGTAYHRRERDRGPIVIQQQQPAPVPVSIPVQQVPVQPVAIAAQPISAVSTVSMQPSMSLHSGYSGGAYYY